MPHSKPDIAVSGYVRGSKSSDAYDWEHDSETETEQAGCGACVRTSTRHSSL